MSDVIPLHGEQPAEEVNNGVVGLLRDALARALRGGIEHIAIVYTDKEGNPGGTYDGKPSHILFALARMERRVHNYVDGKQVE